ncbi:MAG: sugar ABC transporter permease [Chloroflexi bacterium]|nr:sugar ABC transporter permease [Chloroflexota bacterium]
MNFDTSAARPSSLLRPLHLSLKVRDALFGYVFVGPMVVGFVLTVLLPLVAVFLYSFQDRNMLTGTWQYVESANYQNILGGDPLFTKVLINSLVFTLGLVPLNVVLALVLAVLLNRAIRGVTFFRTLFFAPVVTSAAAWAIVWKFILQGENGTLNLLLDSVGIDGPNWLRDGNWAMFSVIFTRALKNVGLNMIILLAALQSIPREYDEAAQVDGATAFDRFRRITVPLLSPTILLVTVLTVVGSLKVFDHIVLMTNGGPSNATMVLVNYIYFQAFKVFDTGYASALAVILFAIALVATLTQWFLRKRFVYSEV